VINILVLSILVLLAVVVVVWLVGPKVRAHTERPKYEMLDRILRFEDELPRRPVRDPHESPRAPR